MVQQAKRLVEGREGGSLAEACVLPFGKHRQALHGMADEAPQKPRVQTFREAIDRFHARHGIGVIGGRDMVRMHDLAHPVILIEEARDDSPRP